MKQWKNIYKSHLVRDFKKITYIWQHISYICHPFTNRYESTQMIINQNNNNPIISELSIMLVRTDKFEI